MVSKRVTRLGLSALLANVLSASHAKKCITRGVTGKQKMQGFSCNGYFQEYVCVDARNTMVLPEELDVTLAAQLELKIAD